MKENNLKENNLKWSEEAWAAVQPLYSEILLLPFVRELAAGSLPQEKFAFYLRQDALYLNDYARVLAHIASRLHKKSDIARFIAFAGDGMAVENAMHEVFLNKYGVRTDCKSPSCLLYTSYLKAQAAEDVAIELAAVLPCFKVYLEVGKAIAAKASPHNPYEEWIATYSDPVFEQSTRDALAIADKLASAASPSVRRAMTERFEICTKMEWLFWYSAYELEQWKI